MEALLRVHGAGIQLDAFLIEPDCVADATERQTLAGQFDDLLAQIDALAADSGYKGTNLLDGDTLTVTLNEDGSNTLDVVGFSADSTASEPPVTTGGANSHEPAAGARPARESETSLLKPFAAVTETT